MTEDELAERLRLQWGVTGNDSTIEIPLGLFVTYNWLIGYAEGCLKALGHGDDFVNKADFAFKLIDKLMVANASENT